jgi:hypothetical protein
MTVSTPNYTLRDLTDYALPRISAANHDGDFVRLGARVDVIEVQTPDIRFPAVDAWMIGQVVKQPLPRFRPRQLRPPSDVGYVPCAIRLVPGTAAVAATRLQTIRTALSAIELVEWPHPLAGAAELLRFLRIHRVPPGGTDPPSAD